MSLCELQVKTLQGGVFTLDVRNIQTVEQLKRMLLEVKSPGDPVEQKILQVEVLHGSCLLNEAQTLRQAALQAESDVTVIYRRNEIEAATKSAVRNQGFCQVNIPQTATEVSSEAFSDCTELVKVTIPDSVTQIGRNAFTGCSSLESITIPDSVTEIGRNAFSGCSSLTSITIPHSVAKIGRKCLYWLQLVEKHHHSRFSGWDWIQSLCRLQLFERHHNSYFGDRLRPKLLPAAALWKASPFLIQWLKLGGMPLAAAALWKASPFLIQWLRLGGMPLPAAARWKASPFQIQWLRLDPKLLPAAALQKGITIPDSVTEIGSFAFHDCSSLKKITIPSWRSWRANIGPGAFFGCSSLASITMSDSLTDIESSALTCYSSLIKNAFVSRFLIWRLTFCPFDLCRSSKANRRNR